jgi:hypothetical protein
VLAMTPGRWTWRSGANVDDAGLAGVIRGAWDKPSNDRFWNAARYGPAESNSARVSPGPGEAYRPS